MESILTSIKKLLGLTEEDTSFDQDVIMHINTVLMDLTQLKVGPSTGFIIEDKTSVWTDFVKNPTRLQAIKSYIYLRVRLLFDPPSSAAAIASMEKQVDKFEWLINVAAESENSGIIDENVSEEIKALIAELESENEKLKTLNIELTTTNAALTADNSALETENDTLKTTVEELEASIKPEQEKEVTITENGNVDVLPDDGNTLSKVVVTVDVASVDNSEAIVAQLEAMIDESGVLV